MSETIAELQILRAELSNDLMLCSTRDQHIRMVQRITRLDNLLLRLAQTV